VPWVGPLAPNNGGTLALAHGGGLESSQPGFQPTAYYIIRGIPFDKQAAMQQQSSFQLLTDEQEKILEETKKHGKWSSLFHVLAIFQLIWGLTWMSGMFHHLFQPPLVFVAFPFAPLNFMQWRQLSNFQDKTRKLYSCTDTAVAGVLTKAVMVGKKEDRAACVATLIPLLYIINNRQAAMAFTSEHRKILRNIASRPYWRKHEPDLVAAALVALVALDDSKSRDVLERLAKKSWGNTEMWVGEAARLCLKQWGNRWETPATMPPPSK
jgi:ligand-binding SRPBCC domain-containing protein